MHPSGYSHRLLTIRHRPMVLRKVQAAPEGEVPAQAPRNGTTTLSVTSKTEHWKKASCSSLIGNDERSFSKALVTLARRASKLKMRRQCG